MGKIRCLAGLLAVLASVCTGCSGEGDAQKKRVRELQEELTRLQNSHDRLDERLTSIELSRQASGDEPAPAHDFRDEPSEETPVALERPPLKVFRLAPSASRPPEAAPEADGLPSEEPGIRPVIRGRGQHIEKTSGSSGASGGGARVPKLSQNGQKPPAGTGKASP